MCWRFQRSTADSESLTLILVSASQSCCFRMNVNVTNFVSLLVHQLSVSLSRKYYSHVKLECTEKSSSQWCKHSLFSGICVCKCCTHIHTRTHTHTHTHTYSKTHSDMSIPRVLSLFVFRSAVQGGSGYSESVQYLRSSLPLQVPWIPLPSLYRAEIMDDSLFPSRTWQRTEKKRIETKQGEKAF